MDKQKKQILILILLLVVVVVGYFGLKVFNQKQKEKEANEKQASKVYVLSLNKDDIQKISYTYDGIDYTFQRDGDKWIYPTDTSVVINKTNLELMAGSASKIEAVETIENVTDLEQYGLSEPVKTIEIATDEKTYCLYVGDYNTTISKYYVYLDDPSTVYTVYSNSVTCFNKTLDDVKEKTEETESVEE